MKKIIYIFSTILAMPYFGFAGHIYDSLDIQSSFNPVGSGARAMGMSGAFIAVSDDATSASWNPGGLIQLRESEISIVGEISNWSEKNLFERDPDSSFNSNFSDQNINYLSLVSPIYEFNNRVIIFSINYQHLFSFHRELDFRFREIEAHRRYVYYNEITQDGYLSAIGIACCFLITEYVSFGLTLNFWNDFLVKNGWTQKIVQNGKLSIIDPDYESDIDIYSQSILHNNYSFKGFNINLGFRWEISDKFVLGGVYKTPFTADLDHKYTYKSSTSIGNPILIEKHLHEELSMPKSYGLGIAYRFSDELTISADIYRTDWQDCILKDSEGEYSFITGIEIEKSNINPITQIRIGAEYLFINKKYEYSIPLRGGIFYDPSPAEGSPDDLYGFTVGSGFSKGHYNFDIAFQYRYGSDVGQSKIAVSGFSQKLQEYKIYSSFIYHFSD